MRNIKRLSVNVARTELKGKLAETTLAHRHYARRGFFTRENHAGFSIVYCFALCVCAGLI